MNVLFRFDLDDSLADLLDPARQAGMSVTVCPESGDEAYLAALPDCDVLWHVLRPVTAEHIAAAPRLRLIQKVGVGVNTIDLDAARAAGIAVCNMPGSNSQAVAEMTLALMLACLRRIPTLDRIMAQGTGWSWPKSWQGGFGEIGGRTVGLVGAGAVPRVLIPILRALGATVLVHARRDHPEIAAMGARQVSKAELLSASDIVSLHIPQTGETAGWLDRQALASMKRGAILINTARGGLVDETALATALSDGRIAAAGLDVFASEPVAADNPLLGLENVVATPHLAWLTRDTIARSMAIATDNSLRLKEGRDLINRVA